VTQQATARGTKPVPWAVVPATRVRPDLRVWPGPGAQRLSASLSSPLLLVADPRPHLPVLNAFRRHCLHHGAVHREELLLQRVLNAFRRHCLHHAMALRRASWLPRAQRLSASLSSPRTGRTSGRGRAWCAQRLSASLSSPLHHQNGPHGLNQKCSTPFGVTVFTTTLSPAALARASLCSTPFGVTVFTTPSDPPSDPRRRVLNAFRRHCLHHGRRRPNSPRGAGRAQRLSASLSSPHHSITQNTNPARCSTPFGVTVFTTM
jgi:hypothetical protein